jgi:hypothetical protein
VGLSEALILLARMECWSPLLQPARSTRVYGRIRRRPSLGGLINEYETGA